MFPVRSPIWRTIRMAVLSSTQLTLFSVKQSLVACLLSPIQWWKGERLWVCVYVEGREYVCVCGWGRGGCVCVCVWRERPDSVCVCVCVCFVLTVHFIVYVSLSPDFIDVADSALHRHCTQTLPTHTVHGHCPRLSMLVAGFICINRMITAWSSQWPCLRITEVNKTSNKILCYTFCTKIYL